MSRRSKQEPNTLIDWRTAPLAFLCLGIGAVVSFSIGSNLGIGYVAIDKLPESAAELAKLHSLQLEDDADDSVRKQIAKSIAAPQATPVAPAAPEEPVATAVKEPAKTAPAEVAKTDEKVKQPVAPALPAAPQATTVQDEGADPQTAAVTRPEAPQTGEEVNEVAQQSAADSEAAEVVVDTPVEATVTEDIETGIVRIEVGETLEPIAAAAEDGLPDTAEIVAEANRAAGVRVEEESDEPAFEVLVPEKDESLSRYSTDPEDLPILRVIEPDAETPEAPVEIPETDLLGAQEETEVTLSREITDAVDSGVVEKVMRLITEGEPIDGRDRSGQTMLLKAAWNGDTEMFYALMERGADINVMSNDGRTPLFSATVSGNEELVRELVRLGASVNTRTNEGKTPLMVSAWSNYPEIARFLLEQGAKPDEIDGNGRNALFYALWDRNIDVIRTLIQYGAGMEQVDNDGHSAVDIARLRRIQLPGMVFESDEKNIN